MKHMVRGFVCLAFAAGMSFAALADFFVDGASTTPESPYGSPEKAATTIADALAAAKDAIVAGDASAVIHIANGTYDETGFVLDGPIAIVGASRDGVIINDDVVGNRAFTLSHADAVVRNLTVRGPGLRLDGGNGGHVHMSSGLVENCVIDGGRASPSGSYGNGGNIYMSGGKLFRCLVTDGKCSWGAWKQAQSYGMAVYATGGTIDSCFFKDNKDTESGKVYNYGGVYLKGAVSLLNSTITGGTKSYDNKGLGVLVGSASATVANCVIYKNGDNSALQNFGDMNLNRFFNCASSVAGSSGTGWQVVTDDDFVNTRTGSDLHPVVTSKLVDTGDTTKRPEGCATLDLDGNDRVSGTAVDIGCWELDQSAFNCGGYLPKYEALVGSGVEFIAKVVGPATSTLLEWDFGNGVTATTTDLIYTYAYPAGGLFTVKLRASPDGGTTWTDWKDVASNIAVAPSEIWVEETSEKPTFPYSTRETAARNLDVVFAMLTNSISGGKPCVNGVKVRVCPGTYQASGMYLPVAMSVVGETDNPADVNIVDDVVGKRAFTLSHADAVVKNLTISGNGIRTNGSSGGHVNMSAGLVENCVIKDGRASPSSGYGTGGNIAMSGGKLVRCLVTGGKSNWGGWYNANNYGMAIYATGGTIDSCFFKDNKVDDNNSNAKYGVYLNGAVKLINCTVTGGSSYRDKKGVGVYVASSSATVVNCVIYGNGDNSAAQNFGDTNLGRFFYCASAVAGSSGTEWKVLTNEDFADFAGGDLRPKSGSQLVDHGTSDTQYRPADCTTLDLDGNDRISGKEIDIGCWELDQSQLSVSGYPLAYAALENEAITFHASAVGTVSDLVFRWDYDNGTVEDTREEDHVYRYPASGMFTPKLAASPDGGTTWTDWYVLPRTVVVAPAVMFVDPACETPTYPYKTPATASTTLTAALAALTNNLSENATSVNGAEVRIAKGSTLSETGFRINSAVTVCGETDDPKDVEIVDQVSGKRAFSLLHEGARVANLTISGVGLQSNDGGEGGHVWMSAGCVENCIIRDGTVGYGGTKGGNVLMSGGRLVRCQILDGKASPEAHKTPASYGGGVYASGGTIDTCLVANNQAMFYSKCGGIYVAGAATVLNCTLIGNQPPPKSAADETSAGIWVASSDATVANCVFYDNGDGSAYANFGTANLDRFQYCASSVTNESCATWRVMDATAFKDYANYLEGGELKYLSPVAGGVLQNGGCTAADYLNMGGSAEKDLLGRVRISGKYLDIGCIEKPTLGLMLMVR